MADLLGAVAAKDIAIDINSRLEDYKNSSIYYGRLPKLAIVRVGERVDDIYYEKAAIKKIESLGMEVESITFPADIDNLVFQEAFTNISKDDGIDGILLFSPLPKSLDEKKILTLMDPSKDVDGLTIINQGRLYTGDKDGFSPCTAEAALILLKSSGVDLTGKKITVVGRSMVIGKPLSMLLLSENATVTICHSKSRNLHEECRRADIVVAAIGKAKMIDSSYISKGAIVIDVGINNDDDGNMCGDVDYESVSDIASFITPVPRGVGSLTTTILASHLLKAAINRAKNKRI